MLDADMERTRKGYFAASRCSNEDYLRAPYELDHETPTTAGREGAARRRSQCPLPAKRDRFCQGYTLRLWFTDGRAPRAEQGAPYNRPRQLPGALRYRGRQPR